MTRIAPPRFSRDVMGKHDSAHPRCLATLPPRKDSSPGALTNGGRASQWAAMNSVTRRAVACLFDLDGTILDSRKCGTRALEAAFRELYGIDDPLAGVPIAGRTDLAIVEEVLRRRVGPAGRPRDPGGGGVERFKERYCAHLERELARVRPLLCPGFPALLGMVESAAGAPPVIATGNFRAGAEMKLRAAGIDPALFPCGAFGCEAVTRVELLAIAAGRARARGGAGVVPLVVGDTPEDLKGARGIGAPAALVATGPFPCEELAALDPEFIAHDLADPAPFLALVASLRAGGA